MNTFTTWFATSPLATSLRVAAGLGAAAALDYVAKNVGNFNLPVVVQLAVAAAIPPILRALNPADGVYGKGETVVED